MVDYSREGEQANRSISTPARKREADYVSSAPTVAFTNPLRLAVDVSTGRDRPESEDPVPPDARRVSVVVAVVVVVVVDTSVGFAVVALETGRVVCSGDGRSDGGSAVSCWLPIGIELPVSGWSGENDCFEPPPSDAESNGLSPEHPESTAMVTTMAMIS